MKDYYVILKINRSETELEIKRQFKKLLRENQPDNNQKLTTDKFIELKEAFEVLSNKDIRKHYDELLALKENNREIKEKDRKLWEEKVDEASQRGRRKGQKNMDNYNYFSKEVITESAFRIFVEIFIDILLGGSTLLSYLVLSLILTIAGIVVTIFNWGSISLMFIGIAMTVSGFFWFRNEILKEFKERS